MRLGMTEHRQQPIALGGPDMTLIAVHDAQHQVAVRVCRRMLPEIAAHAEAIRLSARRTAAKSRSRRHLPRHDASSARAKLRGDQLVKFVPRIGGFDVITAAQAFPDRRVGGQHTAQRIRPRTGADTASLLTTSSRSAPLQHENRYRATTDRHAHAVATAAHHHHSDEGFLRSK
jgi:hypothetical protein